MQPRYPSVGDYINNRWYIQTVEYYSVQKRNKVQTIKRHGRNLKAYCSVKAGSLK